MGRICYFAKTKEDSSVTKICINKMNNGWLITIEQGDIHTSQICADWRAVLDYLAYIQPSVLTNPW